MFSTHQNLQSDDMIQFNDSALSADMSLLDISIESGSGSPSPRFPSPRTLDQKGWRSLRRRAEYDDQDTLGNTIIMDNIHGNIEVHPVCQAIIDTPQFDR